MDERLNKRLREIETLLEKKRALDRELEALLFPERTSPLEELVEAVEKKRGRPKKEKVEVLIFDPETDVSNCCRDRVVVRGGGPGNEMVHYECMKCGDACYIVSKDEPLPEKPKRRGGGAQRHDIHGEGVLRVEGSAPQEGLHGERQRHYLEHAIKKALRM